MQIFIRFFPSFTINGIDVNTFNTNDITGLVFPLDFVFPGDSPYLGNTLWFSVTNATETIYAYPPDGSPVTETFTILAEDMIDENTILPIDPGIPYYVGGIEFDYGPVPMGRVDCFGSVTSCPITVFPPTYFAEYIPVLEDVSLTII